MNAGRASAEVLLPAAEEAAVGLWPRAFVATEQIHETGGGAGEIHTQKCESLPAVNTRHDTVARDAGRLLDAKMTDEVPAAEGGSQKDFLRTKCDLRTDASTGTSFGDGRVSC